MWQPQGLYSQFTLRMPVILSGKEALRGLYHYPGRRFAVLHGATLLNEDKELFKQVFKKKELRFIKRGWSGEPTLGALSQSIHELEEYQPDVLIAFGGGSVIDGAKLCRLYYEFPFFDALCPRIDGSGLKTKFIAVPTTIGSGAEVSSAAVYWDAENHRKDMVVVHELLPDVIVYDSSYVEDTPKRLLYASALDGMSHIIEGYISNVQNEMVQMLGEKGLAVFRQCFLEEVIPDFSRLQYAGYIGGIVQNHCIVGAAHAIAHQLTGYGFSHGEAVGLVLPSVIRLNCEDEECKKKYALLAQQAGFADRDAMLAFIEELLRKSGIGERRQELKSVMSAHFDSMIDNIIKDRGGKGNLVPITEEYVKKVTGSL